MKLALIVNNNLSRSTADKMIAFEKQLAKFDREMKAAMKAAAERKQKHEADMAAIPSMAERRLLNHLNETETEWQEEKAK